MKQVASHLCRTCGTKMTEVVEGTYSEFPWHPLCAPDDVVVPGTDETFGELGLREALTDVILWADQSSSRSKQIALGCSEVGDPCLRKIGMTMAGVERRNYSADPWPSIVGTAVHQWLDRAVQEYQRVHGTREWLTELEVWPSEWLPGHTDLYHRPSGTVLDLKNPSRTNFRKMLKEGFGTTYETQVQLYGEGNRRAGREVRRVGFVMLPRDGHLREMKVKTYPFDPAAVQSAFTKIEDLADALVKLGLPASGRWDLVDAEPHYILCQYCPFLNRDLQMASSQGCPGRAKKKDNGSVDDLF